ILFDPAEQKMTYSSFKPFEQSMATEQEPGVIIFKGSFGGLSLHSGNVLTIRDPYRDNCGAFISLSKNISLDHLKMHYMHGLGIVAQFSENLSYKNVRVAPPENSGRIISSFADCFHFSGCKGKILIDSCLSSGSHDDPINVHGTHLKITEMTEAGKIRVRFMHHQTYGFNAFFKADSIAFIDPQTLKPLAYAKLRNARLLNLREMELELDPSILKNIPMGTCIENISWTPEVVIKNSRFERTNTRGILVTTRRKVLIENNVFYKTGMHAILIANDASGWYESGAVSDVTIRNNIFEECGYNSAPGGYVISIAPENHKKFEGYYVHRNIRIENNVFKVSAPAILGARSVQGLIFRNNKVEQTGNKISGAQVPCIRLDGCNNVSITQNSFRTSWTPKVDAKGMENAKLNTDIK
ncbi:MAG TPA: right-handed parallel beta-helix repeat-containing protein, partial [Chitinophagaceae bacterium]|nr:right-handed parallel beta-helix repeat-containing protein [Chitinophagaceae bacterium]